MIAGGGLAAQRCYEMLRAARDEVAGGDRANTSVQTTDQPRAPAACSTRAVNYGRRSVLGADAVAGSCAYGREVALRPAFTTVLALTAPLGDVEQ